VGAYMGRDEPEMRMEMRMKMRMKMRFEGVRMP
jgi:hypothetical protein